MRQFIVDAFTDKVFSGNPAAVCVMKDWISEDLMMKITKENNLSETAFAVKNPDGSYKLRWFTPGGEIDLCGHATLGTAYVIMKYYDTESTKIDFHTLSGVLTVKKNENLYEMDFPAYNLQRIDVTSEMEDAIGALPSEAYMGRDLLCIFDDEDTIRKIEPDMEKVKNLDGLLLQVTAKGQEYDCVSRSFAPKLNVVEDPVCGSGHCHIVPYWARTLGKNEIIAFQASERGGVLYCKMEKDRVKISGHVAAYSIAELLI